VAGLKQDFKNLSFAQCSLVRTMDGKLDLNKASDAWGQMAGMGAMIAPGLDEAVSYQTAGEVGHKGHHHGMDHNEAKQLAQELPQRHHLKELTIMHGTIGDEGVQAIAEVLPQCLSLEHLDIRGNGITEVGAGHLAKAIAKCGLLELDLYNNDIGGYGAKLIAEKLRYSQLQKLILSTNNIGEDGAKAMARWLPYSPNLKELSLDHNDIGEEGAFEIAKVLHKTSLQKLHVRGNNITDEASKLLEASRRKMTLPCRIFGLSYA